MLLAGQRIELDPKPQVGTPPALEVVMLGHCPVASTDVNWPRIANDRQLTAELHGLGFGIEVRRLRELLTPSADFVELETDDDLKALYKLPLPIRSLAQFKSIFSGVFDQPYRYGRLAGYGAWLPRAVEDFFGCSDNSGQLKLWIIRVKEADGIEAFLPSRYGDLKQRATETSNATPRPLKLLEIDQLNAFERALLIQNAAVIALPDLERLNLPQGLKRIPSVRKSRPLPAFLPCSSDADDLDLINPFRDIKSNQPRPQAKAVVGAIGQTLAVHRPDMQCLLSLPFADSQDYDFPQLCPEFSGQLSQLADAAIANPASGDSQRLRHLQFLYPYLIGADNLLTSSCGVVAGMQAKVAASQGVWRSVAGRRLPVRSLPWPRLDQNEAVRLRTRPGVTVLCNHKGTAMIDDESLCVPILPSVDLLQLTPSERNDSHWRSAEIMRFMGWLRRELQAQGNRMIFDTDPRDPRPLMALREFFQQLHALGALRGKKASEAFTIQQRNPADNVLQFDIEVAPAFPVDRIRITFLQDRHSGGSIPTMEAAHG